MNNFSRIKLALKHLLGRDLYLQPNVKMAVDYHGTRYEGWAVPKDSVSKDSVIYSFGIGENVSWDLGLIAATGCTVLGFDPTPKSQAWVAREVSEPRFVAHPFGLADTDGEIELWLPSNPEFVSASCRPSEMTSDVRFMAPCKSLATVMAEFDHGRVDVLKMDIEGAEYAVIRALCEDPALLGRVGVLLIEFHHWMSSFTTGDTKDAIRALESRGFQIAWVSERGHEVLFVRPGDFRQA